MKEPSNRGASIGQVLLIEDDSELNSLLKRMFDAAPVREFEVTVAEDLRDGLAHLRRQSYDAVILDLNLPDSHGEHTVRRLRDEFPEIPIVVLTGITDPSMATRVLRIGVQDYLQKPTGVGTELLRAVRHAIERHRFTVELDRQGREIRASEARIRAIIEASADAILVVDTQGTVQFANEAAGQLFGKRVARLLNQPFEFELLANQRTEVRIGEPGDSQRIAELRTFEFTWHGEPAFRVNLHDITERKHHETERENLIRDLQEALANVKTLRGLLPMCAGCKKIRDDKNYWVMVETYIEQHSDATFTHGYCPDCARKYFPNTKINLGNG